MHSDNRNHGALDAFVLSTDNFTPQGRRCAKSVRVSREETPPNIRYKLLLYNNLQISARCAAPRPSHTRPETGWQAGRGRNRRDANHATAELISTRRPETTGSVCLKASPQR